MMESQEKRSSATMLVWGIILVLVGIAGFAYTSPQMDQMNSGLGQLVTALNPGAANEFQMWRIGYYVSIGMMVVGGLLFIGGIIQQTQKK